MNDQDETKKDFSEAQRCSQLMNRIADVIGEEFPDISPPRVIFVLNWLEHRYFVEIEYLVHGKQVPEPEPAQHVMQPVRI